MKDITVNLVRDSTGKITQKLLAEKADPQADVVWAVAATSLLLLDAEDMLEPYAPAGLDRVPTKFRDLAAPPTGSVWMYICRRCVSTPRC